MRFIFLNITTLTPVKTQFLNLYHSCHTGLSLTKFDFSNISILPETCNPALSGCDCLFVICVLTGSKIIVILAIDEN